MIQYLFGIAKADGIVSDSEMKVIKEYLLILEFLLLRFEQIKSLFTKILQVFKVLGIEESATNDEIKKAYRKMAVKHHPINLINLERSNKKQLKICSKNSRSI